MKFFILYNIGMILFLLINFVIIYIGIHKFNLGDNKYWRTYHWLFDRVDIFYNWHLSIYFYDRHRGWDETISDRIRRYLELEHHTVKYKLAKFFAAILNQVDEGHC